MALRFLEEEDARKNTAAISDDAVSGRRGWGGGGAARGSNIRGCYAFYITARRIQQSSVGECAEVMQSQRAVLRGVRVQVYIRSDILP